ncbi:PepSY-associated TM helix domain-containing protein [Haloferula sargassicola]|uniref:PepSY domain-containing protein n=1 Tax=Haloferula sargassicola TaxID=490096 RepID=A0ABP9ULL7_9BACT
MNRFPLLRKFIFWSHLVIGLAAGVLILVMAATGTVLSFERQITEAADRYPVEVKSQRLSVSELHQRLRDQQPDARPSGYLVRSDPQRPVVFQFGREKSLFVDPYTGQVLGEGATGTREFFRTVTAIHRWLAMEGAARETSRAVMSAAALCFLFLLISGLFLWLPKRWTRKGVKAIATLQPRLKGRARDWNWHNALGLWFALPLIVTVSTGLVIAYPWANELLFKAAGEKPPERKGHRGRGGPGEAPVALPAGLDRAIAAAASNDPDWRQIQFSFPRKKQLTLFVSDSHRGRPDLRREVTVDLTTGGIVETKDFASQSTGRRLRTWVRWIHTGEAGGWIGQTISALASLAAVILIYTGFALSFRRFFLKRRTSLGSRS